MRPPDPSADPLEQLTASILQSPRYRSLNPAVVRRIGARELARRKTWKEAEKETRNRLHQVCGAYLETRPAYARWVERLRQAPDEKATRAQLLEIMSSHASTRERLSILEGFYERALAPMRPIRTVLDVACGFNPLALPWMGLPEGAAYAGYDLASDMMEFAREVAEASLHFPPITVATHSCDLAVGPPRDEADVALVLKFLPLLEQAGTLSALDWLRQLRTKYALVSFPTRTLGGRNVGMAETYAMRFGEVLEQAGWSGEKIEFSNELCFAVELTRS